MKTIRNIIQSKQTDKHAPNKPGIYIGYNKTSKGNLRLTYIGEAKNLRKRLHKHPKGCTHFTWEIIEGWEGKRKKREKELIKKHHPLLNQKHRTKHIWNDKI